MTNIKLFKGDIPATLQFGDSVAVDCEMMGLDLHRDRLCLVQLGDGNGNAYLVQIMPGKEYPNLKKLLTDEKVLKWTGQINTYTIDSRYKTISEKEALGEEYNTINIVDKLIEENNYKEAYKTLLSSRS